MRTGKPGFSKLLKSEKYLIINLFKVVVFPAPGAPSKSMLSLVFSKSNSLIFCFASSLYLIISDAIISSIVDI